MFKDGTGERPVLVTLVSLFYTVASVGAAAVVLLSLAGIMPVELPPGFTVQALAVEVVLFLFMAYGLRKGWRIGWAATVIMNVIWLFMDVPKLASGELFSVVPVAIAAATLLVMLLGKSRAYFRLTH